MQESWVRPNWQKRVIAALVCLGMLGLDGLGWLSPVKAPAEAGSIWLRRAGLGAKDTLEAPLRAVVFVRHGSQKLADLEARLAERVANEQELQKLRRENRELRQMLADRPNDAWGFLPVEVVGESETEMTVVGGKNVGVHEGMSVVLGKVLVGRISKASEVVSQVEKVGKGDSLVSAMVADSRVSGLVKEQGGRMVMDEISQVERVEAGDVVVTSGIDGTIPGLLVGVVVEVEEAGSGVYKKAVLRPLLVERRVDLVYIVMTREED